MNILCLGNQTEDTNLQAKQWADLLSATAQVSDLAVQTIDDIWAATGTADLLILLDQPIDSYDHYETYSHYESLARYKQQFMPVLIAAEAAPQIWITDTRNNSYPINRIIKDDIQDSNLVIKLSTVADLDEFQQQLEKLTAELVARRCRWVYYRAGHHEPLHRPATELLLTYPEFVLLNPGVFTGDMEQNIQRRIYQHWVDLYIKNRYERSRI